MVWLLTAEAAAQQALPTPEAYEVSPSTELDSGAGEALPEPPGVELDPDAMPEGYEPFVPGAIDARLAIVHWGGGPFRLVLTRDEPGAEPDEICVSPCTRGIAPGQYRVSIGRPNSDARRADDEQVRLTPGTNVFQIHYDHRVGERSVGWTTLLFGLSVGASMVPLGLTFLIIVTPIFAGLGLLIGLPLIFLEDSARFEVFQPANQPDPR